MARLIYIANVTLDCYVEDAEGKFDFTEPSDEVFAFITDLVAPVGTSIYGRRMYETMAVWETEPEFAQAPGKQGEFAAWWMAMDKVVYSTTLNDVATERSEIVRSLDADAVRARKASATADLAVGGAELAAQFFEAGLVDEVHLFVSPVTVGAGKPALPTRIRLDLELVDQRRFDSGTVYLRHAVRQPTAAG